MAGRKKSTRALFNHWHLRLGLYHQSQIPQRLIEISGRIRLFVIRYAARIDIDNALFILQSKKQSLALVKDSAGMPSGFFTMEDLLEELVGEI